MRTTTKKQTKPAPPRAPQLPDIDATRSEVEKIMQSSLKRFQALAPEQAGALLIAEAALLQSFAIENAAKGISAAIRDQTHVLREQVANQGRLESLLTAISMDLRRLVEKGR